MSDKSFHPIMLNNSENTAPCFCIKHISEYRIGNQNFQRNLSCDSGCLVPEILNMQACTQDESGNYTPRPIELTGSLKKDQANLEASLNATANVFRWCEGACFAHRMTLLRALMK